MRISPDMVLTWRFIIQINSINHFLSVIKHLMKSCNTPPSVNELVEISDLNRCLGLGLLGRYVNYILDSEEVMNILILKISSRRNLKHTLCSCLNWHFLSLKHRPPFSPPTGKINECFTILTVQLRNLNSIITTFVKHVRYFKFKTKHHLNSNYYKTQHNHNDFIIPRRFNIFIYTKNGLITNLVNLQKTFVNNFFSVFLAVSIWRYGPSNHHKISRTETYNFSIFRLIELSGYSAIHDNPVLKIMRESAALPLNLMGTVAELNRQKELNKI
ncbi:hypothetical protein AGLY_001139 [Aphis glycines]|uniref:Uncharacterized protein n=1 Tax=Aphis glycines TaxID=307491 RepID=A0A6G0UBF8_APHGL|nr:hypothetical protein AGLY_001139 [Aphis glycines]